MGISLALKGNRPIGFLPIATSQQMPQPFSKIECEKWNVEPFQLLTAMNEFVVKYQCINALTMSCEHNPKQCDSHIFALWHQLRFKYLRLHSIKNVASRNPPQKKSIFYVTNLNIPENS